MKPWFMPKNDCARLVKDILLNYLKAELGKGFHFDHFNVFTTNQLQQPK